MSRILITASPGVTFAEIGPHLLSVVGSAEEVAVICNWDHGTEYAADWGIEDWARERAYNVTVSFSDPIGAVHYVRGGALAMFHRDSMGRMTEGIREARDGRRWWQRPNKYRDGRWRDHRVRVNVIHV